MDIKPRLLIRGQTALRNILLPSVRHTPMKSINFVIVGDYQIASELGKKGATTDRHPILYSYCSNCDGRRRNSNPIHVTAKCLGGMQKDRSQRWKKNAITHRKLSKYHSIIDTNTRWSESGGKRGKFDLISQPSVRLKTSTSELLDKNGTGVFTCTYNPKIMLKLQRGHKSFVI